MDEIKFAEEKIAASEDKILEIMVAADTRKEALKKAEACLKADTAENEKEKESARLRTAEDEKELAELGERRKQLRSGVSEDVLNHYDRVLKRRGSALSAVHEDQMCSACRVMLRPQVFQEVMTNQQFITCDYCHRILYYVPPPPKPEEAKEGKSEPAAQEPSSEADHSEKSADACPGRSRRAIKSRRLQRRSLAEALASSVGSPCLSCERSERSSLRFSAGASARRRHSFGLPSARADCCRVSPASPEG